MCARSSSRFRWSGRQPTAATITNPYSTAPNPIPNAKGLPPKRKGMEATKQIRIRRQSRVGDGHEGRSRFMSSWTSGLPKSPFTTARAGISRRLAGVRPLSLSVRDLTAS